MHAKLKSKKYIDITKNKTVTIQGLKRRVTDATTILAQATATYESFLTKQQSYNELLTLAEGDYTSKKSNWDLFLTLKSSLNSLKETADSSNEVSQIADEQVKKMIEAWQKVTDQTIRAADSINMTSSYVVSRKAANPLLSNDLVNEATKAAKNADTAVKVVIDALTNALASLSASNQANNSTLLTSNNIDLAVSMILSSAGSEKESDLCVNEGVSKQYCNPHSPIEASLKNVLDLSKERLQVANTAVSNVQTEVAIAKETKDQATADLATLEAALKAAEAAVAG